MKALYDTDSRIAKFANMVALWRAGVLMAWLLCLLQLHHARSQVAANNTTELYIAFITSFGGQYVSSGTVPAVEIALEEINNRADVLPNYKLSLFVGDSQVVVGKIMCNYV